MCTRISPLTLEEAQNVAASYAARGRARVKTGTRALDPIHDAYPGGYVVCLVPRGNGLEAVRLTWGFDLEGKKCAVFNTRIETALDQLRRGRRGLWTEAIEHGRCLVPVRAFYEGSATERVPSEKTGRPVRRPYRFRLPGAGAFLLAAIQADGRMSIVTTVPNASVSPVHNRMPLVLGPGESAIWLGGDFASLADRSRLLLSAEPER